MGSKWQSGAVIAIAALAWAGCALPEGGAGRRPCAIGTHPEYFTSGGFEEALIIGCAELAVSGRRTEFSIAAERIEGEPFLCVNPAYNGRGQRGIYQPSICQPPEVEDLRIADVSVPTQAVRGYELVVWGVAPADIARIWISSIAGRTRPVLFRIRERLARRVGGGPFVVFAAELPAVAACGPVTASAVGGDSTGPRPADVRLCRHVLRADRQAGGTRGEQDSALEDRFEGGEGGGRGRSGEG